MERTLILVKPDAVQRGLTGEIITRFERKGLKLVGARFLQISNDLAARHYAVHKSKPFYNDLIKYITSGPVMAMALEGKGAVAVCRKLMGATFGKDAEPGTIRGDFAMDKLNIVHGSDSIENAEYEISLYFKPDDLVEYELNNGRWIN